MMYHAQEKIVNVPGSRTDRTARRDPQFGDAHGAQPTHMIGGYAQQSYGFNYYGTVGTNRDEFVTYARWQHVGLAGWPAAEQPGGPAAELEAAGMKIRAQIAMVLNLDKCIGCHTCSVTCKNVWTNREGMEYAWFNNVETKPGIGYPKDRENQTLERRLAPQEERQDRAAHGRKWRVLANIFANPDLPEIDDYYEPFTFDYEHLQKAPELQPRRRRGRAR